MTSFDIPYDKGANYGTRTRFWFSPPETTDYRFYQSCDDDCAVRIGKTRNKYESSNLDTILSAGTYYGYRSYWPDLISNYGKRFRSSWRRLTKG